jgi:hypothetical protein
VTSTEGEDRVPNRWIVAAGLALLAAIVVLHLTGVVGPG